MKKVKLFVFIIGVIISLLFSIKGFSFNNKVKGIVLSRTENTICLSVSPKRKLCYEITKGAKRVNLARNDNVVILILNNKSQVKEVYLVEVPQ